MLHGMLLVRVGSMPVLGARRYVGYVAFDCIKRTAPPLLHPPSAFEEVEHLLSTMDVPEGSRPFRESDARGGELAGLVGGYGLEVRRPGEVIGRSFLALYVVRVLEM